jgi:hypothetical protein
MPVEFFSSAFIDASIDCHSLRKLSVPEAISGRKLVKAAPARSAPCIDANPLPWPGVGFAPVPISIPAATVMGRDKAEDVPKEEGAG